MIYTSEMLTMLTDEELLHLAKSVTDDIEEQDLNNIIKELILRIANTRK